MYFTLERNTFDIFLIGKHELGPAVVRIKDIQFVFYLEMNRETVAQLNFVKMTKSKILWQREPDVAPDTIPANIQSAVDKLYLILATQRIYTTSTIVQRTNFYGYNESGYFLEFPVLCPQTKKHKINAITSALHSIIPDLKLSFFNTTTDPLLEFYTQTKCDAVVEIPTRFFKENRIADVPTAEIKFIPLDNCNTFVDQLVCCINMEMYNHGHDPSVEDNRIVNISVLYYNTSVTTTRANMAKEQANMCVYMLGELGPLTDERAEYKTFQNEGDLLRAFVDDLVRMQPDVLIGYNMLRMILPCLRTRLGYYQLDTRILALTKIPATQQQYGSWISNKKIMTSQTVFEHVEYLSCPGVLIFDISVFVQSTYKLSENTLGCAAREILKRDKLLDVSTSSVNIFFLGSTTHRQYLAEYSCQNVTLVMELFIEMGLLLQIHTLARVGCVSPRCILERGMMVCVQSQIMRHIHGTYVLPDYSLIPPTNKTSYRGGKVLQPESGITHTPTVILDFASLYPSIIVAYNICFSTLLDIKSREQIIVTRGDMAGIFFEQLPSTDCFATPHQRLGVLPQIVQNLVESRREDKRQMNKCEPNSSAYVLFNNLQLAKKLLANSVYGFTGALKTSPIPSVKIARAITACGRLLLSKSCRILRALDADTRIIYGDTDSAMITNRRFKTLDSAGIFGQKMAAYVTRILNRPPIECAFKQVVQPFMVLAKKQYIYCVSPQLCA